MPETIIGIMSGSSLDGLDVALCQFNEHENAIEWEIKDALTIPYSDQWFELLKSAATLTGFELMQLDALFGEFIGNQIAALIKKQGWEADYIASHGHTVFHEPLLGFTTQIGSGAHIAFHSDLDTITSFRNADVAAGGQGAPFAPVADLALFSGFEGYLNLGGIANVNLVNEQKQWFAWDICPCNQALNFLARRLNMQYDDGGNIAAQGAVLDKIRHDLISMFPFEGGRPHGLSNAVVQTTWTNYLESRNENSTDLLGTTTLAIADVITLHISSQIVRPAKVLVTGGGAYNEHLIKLLRRHASDFGITYEIPAPLVIDFKESLLMAYLGYLTMHKKPYNINSLTGASHNTGGGALYRAL